MKFAFLVILLVLSGCVSDNSKQLSDFSAAVFQTSENTNSAFNAIEDVHANVETLRTAIFYESKGFNPEDIRPFFAEDAIAIRLEILEGLKVYSNRLAEMGRKENFESFDAETAKLGKTLGKLNDTMVEKGFFPESPVNPSNIRIFTASVNALGHWLIEYKRDKSIQEVTSEMNGPIGEICRLFIEDFGSHSSDGKKTSGLRAQQWNQYSELLMLQDRFIRENIAMFEPEVKKAELDKLYLYTLSRKGNDKNLEELQDSFRRIAEIHNAISNPSSDGDIMKMIGKLQAEGKRINDYYKSLK